MKKRPPVSVDMPMKPKIVRTTPAALVREEKAKPLKKYGDMEFDKATGKPLKFCYREYDDKTGQSKEMVVDLKKK